MIRVRVEPDSGDDFEVTITSRDIANWEKVTKGMTFAKFQDELSMTHLYSLTHFAARRTRQWSGTRAELEELADIVMLGDEDEEGEGEADPTHAGATSET